MSDKINKNKFSKIKLLPEELCNQIAAGEVVERPASVMKELVENALDAKATQINVIVENGGQSLIQVDDNGLGIEKDELPLALTRHATSKLQSIGDLAKILSYGFRGEALPSIASVSKFRICSKTSSSAEAFELRVEFGKIGEVSPCSFQGGTSIEVKDLFLNIPARLKFLKSPATELKKLSELFVRLALVAENIELNLFAGQRLVYSFQKNQDLKARLSQIWSNSITEALLPVNLKNQSLEITGFISKPQSIQPRADKMLFYVNGRAVNDKILLKAVRQAYQGMLTTKDYPQCVLCLNIDPQEIDVNVHPAKNEIRFRDEQLIFSNMHKAINLALETNDSFFSAKNLNKSVQEEISRPQEIQYEPLYKPSPKPQGFWGSADKEQGLAFVKQTQKNDHLDDWEVKHFVDNLENINQLQEVSEQISPLSPNQSWQSEVVRESQFDQHISSFLPAGLEYLGQIAKTYLLLKQKDEALILLDQHAVHERILYEKISKGVVQCQQLLVPLDLPLHPSEIKLLESQLSNLQNMGFELKIMPQICQIYAVPSQLTRQNAKIFIQEIIREKIENLEHIWIKLACSKSIKAHTELGNAEAITLINQWLECDEPDFCPHGRPCVLHFDAHNLELMFKRKA